MKSLEQSALYSTFTMNIRWFKFDLHDDFCKSSLESVIDFYAYKSHVEVSTQSKIEEVLFRAEILNIPFEFLI